MIVRTTMRPDLEVEVDAAEYTDLRRQGLLQPEPPAPAAAPAAPAVPVPPASPDHQESAACQ